MSEEKTIEQLLIELREAKTNLDTKIEEEKTASSRTTDARNVYNGICKRLDVAIRKLKEEAPWNTNWYDQVRSRGEPAA